MQDIPGCGGRYHECVPPVILSLILFDSSGTTAPLTQSAFSENHLYMQFTCLLDGVV